MSISQKELAQRLGVTPTWVSRALNNHPSVSEKSRTRIQQAAKELGYSSRTNWDARSLIARRHGRRLKTDTILAMLPPICEPPMDAPPYFQPFLTGIQAEAEARGIDVLWSTATVAQAPRIIADGGADGVLAMAGNIIALERIRDAGFPAVELCAMSAGVPSVLPDEREGARLVTEHLIALGHRRIGFVGYGDSLHAPSANRLSGYLQALRDDGIAADESRVETTITQTPYTWQSVDRLLDRAGDITALVCHNDDIAMRSIRQLQARGLSVPDQMSVTGFDDISADYHFEPLVTSVRFDRVGAGRRAVSILCALIDANIAKQAAIDSNSQEILPVELIVRDSTAARSA